MIIIKNNSPTEIPKQIGAKVWIDEGEGVGNTSKNSLDLIQDQKLAKLDIVNNLLKENLSQTK